MNNKAKEENDNFCQKITDADNVSIIPHCGGFTVVNIFNYVRNGHPFFLEKAKEMNNSVYKIKTFGEEVIVTDHEAAKFCYDPEKVEKVTRVGLLAYNQSILGGNIPNLFSNDEVHKNRKSALLEYVDKVLKDLTVEKLISLVHNEFEKIPRFQASEDGEKSFNIEIKLKTAASNVITTLLVGEAMDYDLIENFANNTLKLQYTAWMYNDASKEIYETTLDGFKKALSKYDEYIESLANSFKLTKDELLREIMWMVCFNACGSVKSLLVSSLISLMRLQNKDLLSKECQSFFKSEDKSFAKMNELSNLHKFTLEVLRLYPPAPAVYRCARKDSKIQSIEKSYEIKQGDHITSKLFCVHRDATIHKDPHQFSMTRDTEVVEKNLYTFGDRFTEPVTPTNYKCVSQELGLNALKVFILHLLKCDFDAPFIPCYTGKNVLRLEGSDKPFDLSLFMYDVNKNTI